MDKLEAMVTLITWTALGFMIVLCSFESTIKLEYTKMHMSGYIVFSEFIAMTWYLYRGGAMAWLWIILCMIIAIIWSFKFLAYRENYKRSGE